MSLNPNRYLLFGFQHTVKVIHYLTIVKTECILYFIDYYFKTLFIKFLLFFKLLESVILNSLNIKIATIN